MLYDLWHDQDGSTAIEYALIATLVSVAMIVGFRNFSGAMNTMFLSTGNRVAGIN